LRDLIFSYFHFFLNLHSFSSFSRDLRENQPAPPENKAPAIRIPIAGWKTIGHRANHETSRVPLILLESLAPLPLPSKPSPPPPPPLVATPTTSQAKAKSTKKKSTMSSLSRAALKPPPPGCCCPRSAAEAEGGRGEEEEEKGRVGESSRLGDDDDDVGIELCPLPLLLAAPPLFEYLSRSASIIASSLSSKSDGEEEGELSLSGEGEARGTVIVFEGRHFRNAAAAAAVVAATLRSPDERDAAGIARGCWSVAARIVIDRKKARSLTEEGGGKKKQDRKFKLRIISSRKKKGE